MVGTCAKPSRYLSSSLRSSYVLVGSFHYVIHLRSVRNQIPVFDIELLAKLLDHLPI